MIATLNTHNYKKSQTKSQKIGSNNFKVNPFMLPSPNPSLIPPTKPDCIPSSYSTVRVNVLPLLKSIAIDLEGLTDQIHELTMQHCL